MKTTNYKIQKLLSTLMILLGTLLLVFMIVVEDEPGAVPLVMLAAGTFWLFSIRSKIKSKNSW